MFRHFMLEKIHFHSPGSVTVLHPYLKKKIPESYQKMKTMMIFSSSKAFEWMALKKIVF